jgi:uncharacterized phiE125 gp8 family phage protein
MALQANALVTLNQAKDYLSITLADTSKDSWVEMLINSASDLIERHCSRKFKSASYTHYYDGHGNNELVLAQYPVTNISSVKVDTERVFGAETTLGATSFQVMEDGVLRLHSQRFPEGSQVVKVEYTAGYATVPGDLQIACLFSVEWMFRTQNDRRLGRTTVNKGNESVENVPGIPKEVEQILQPFVAINTPSGLMRAGLTG